LNLMPCVLPVIFLKALSILRHAEQRSHTRRHALSYTSGVLCSFAALGAVLLGLRAAGAQVGWGFQLQAPPVVASLAVLMFAIGLNLIGALELRGRLVATISNAGGALASRGGLSGSFFTGVLAVVVATPCTAPFMAAALGAALTLPATHAMGVFLALGLGLALPYLAFALFPALAGLLPPPGEWSQRVKELLAFPMFASAIWLVWVLNAQTGSQGVVVVLGAMLLVAFACWLLRIAPGGDTPRARRLSRLGVGLAGLALFAAAIGLARLEHQELGEPRPRSVLGVEPAVFSPAALSALRDADRPVFLNMTADWCITCLVNERVALSSAAVSERMREKGVVYMKGDWTNHDPDISATLNAFGRSGVPLYVLYPPASSGRQPILLPQLLTASTVLEALDRL
ncbi:MAG: thioredoxin family protein, partial [Gammaproteobacteria bacterium]|nr:thioredoxin family protein [Gammaproteobacteria bacterium]